MQVEFEVSLAECTSFKIGGRAALWFGVSPDSVLEAVLFARKVGGPMLVFGGGSNLLVHESGWPGTVIHLTGPGPEACPPGRILPDSKVEVVAPGGMLWDRFVTHCVRYQWQGIECLSGIPGTVGAAPVQNIAAYGQQVSDVITSVKAADLSEGAWRTFTRGECEFGYRRSFFNRPENTDRFIITEVTFQLTRGGDPCRTHVEIAKGTGPSATVGLVREAVLRVRNRKGGAMPSAGSFFKNPTVSLVELEHAFDAQTVIAGANRWWWGVAEGARVSAAHLIEQSGFAKGHVRGNAGISPMHALSLVNRGGATATEVADLAREIQDGVWAKFNIILEPEVRLIGFPEFPLLRP